MKTFFTFRTLTLLLFASACLQSKFSKAQTTNFITEVNSNEIVRSAEFDRFETLVKKNKDVTQIKYVHISDLSKSQKNGILVLDLPFKGKTITATAKQVKYVSEMDYEWMGTTDEGRGTVIILCKRGRISASISTPGGVYEVTTAPNKLYCFQEIEMASASDVGCFTDHKKLALKKGRRGAENNMAENVNARIEACVSSPNPRVLVLYTPAVLSRAPGGVPQIEDKAAESVAQFNSCIYRSDNFGNSVLTLASVAAFTLSESDDISDDLESFIGSSTAQNLRNQYQADLVVLFTNGAYGERGAAGTLTLEGNRSYAIVQEGYATTSKTFAHEVGHLYGCRHDDDPGTPSYALANHRGSGPFTFDRTIMSTHTSDGSNRLLNFSNPDISVSGWATGDAGHDNSRRVDETYATLAGFRSGPSGTFGAYIEGPTLVYSEGSRTFELVYSCGSAPYSFNWEYSNDGINYYNAGVTSETLSWYFYESQSLFFKGTVTGNGQSYTAYTSVYASIYNPGYRMAVKDSMRINKPVLQTYENTTLNIYPNPGNDFVLIKYELRQAKKVKLHILNQSGQIIHSFVDGSDFQPAGQYSKQWDLSGVAQGIYLCKLQQGEEIEMKRIFVMK